MAARGTGLPSTGAGGLTPLVDFSGSVGIGERAAAEAADQVGALTQRVFDQVVVPQLQDRAVAQAAADVEAGLFQRRMAVTPVGRAYNQALEQGASARAANDIERGLDELRTANLYDPDAFSAAASDARAAAIESAPGWMAGAVAQTFDRRATAHLGSIRSARAERDLTEAKGSLEARIDRLVVDSIAATQGVDLAAALSSEGVQANIAQITGTIEALRDNPAFGLSPEEADALQDTTIAKIKAGAVSGQAVRVLREEGPEAALRFTQSILTDEALSMSQVERDTAFNLAREQVNREVAIQQQIRGAQQQQIAQQEQDLSRLLEEDRADMMLHGGPSRLTEEQVRQYGGDVAVARWIKEAGEALEERNLYGDMSGMTPQQAAEHIASVSDRASGSGRLPVAIADADDFDSLVAAVRFTETGGNPAQISRDPDGAGPAGGGAVGAMQLLPETARRMAQLEGVPFDQNKLLSDPTYNERLGRRYLRTLLDRYEGSPLLAVTAYHAGEGNVDNWIRRHGDPRTGQISDQAWLARIEATGNPRSAAYPRKVASALPSGAADRAWSAYNQQRQVRTTDPATYVATQYPVRAAREAWQADLAAGRPLTPAGEAFVKANLDAQERAGIREGSRRSLPMDSLVAYAGALERYENANDRERYAAVSRRIVQQFGKQGERVLQDVLEVQGMTAYSAQIAAAATRAATSGGRTPSPAQVETAQRGEAMNRAATGTSDRNVRSLSDEDVLRDLGGSPL